MDRWGWLQRGCSKRPPTRRLPGAASGRRNESAQREIALFSNKENRKNRHWLRLQEFAWIADRDRAREGVDMLDGAEHFFNGHAQHRLVDHPQNEDAFEDLAEGLQG